MRVNSEQEDVDERSGLLNKNYINYDQDETDTSEAMSPTKQVQAQNNNGVSWYFAVFLIVNAALGAGVLNFAKAYDNAGGIIYSSIVQLVSYRVLIVFFVFDSGNHLSIVILEKRAECQKGFFL